MRIADRQGQGKRIWTFLESESGIEPGVMIFFSSPLLFQGNAFAFCKLIMYNGLPGGGMTESALRRSESFLPPEATYTTIVRCLKANAFALG